MAAANADEIEGAHPGPIDDSILPRQAQHLSDAIWNGQDSGALNCRSRNEEFNNLEPMVDDHVVDIIKKPETHTFHMSHGKMTIGLQDVEVLFGFPIDGEVVVGNTTLNWKELCRDFLGFNVPEDNTMVLQGQRILIKLLLEQVAVALPPNAKEVQVTSYARCYILVL
ncbi:hypothetical protein SO802_012413 [Lithocarpus litseifolius]|uniref:Aminotransferase-like plant mobile domain-containing protein n=1 Tax=Lithocarpus litseifolius TaxID=425828 RepID=A0AAW2D2N6_9ROSI